MNSIVLLFKGGGNMEQNTRFIKLDTEWSILHLPERPNGFGIFIIGDHHHFVDENTSFWIQNDRSNLTYLLDKGYTVFYSNLYGENWGSPKAVSLAKLLCHIIFKNEILNDRLHILAEGMGALVAIQLMTIMEERFRSAAFLNPCLDLVAHSQKEKEFKLFYKRFIKEFSSAYEINNVQVDEKLSQISFTQYFFSAIPIKIWQPTNNALYPHHIHAKKLADERKLANLPISIAFHLSEKKHGISQSIYNFFHNQEQSL
jgi:hypothetical protein